MDLKTLIATARHAYICYRRLSSCARHNNKKCDCSIYSNWFDAWLSYLQYRDILKNKYNYEYIEIDNQIEVDHLERPGRQARSSLRAQRQTTGEYGQGGNNVKDIPYYWQGETIARLQDHNHKSKTYRRTHKAKTR